MTLEEAIESLDLKFTSGNDIPVERATVTREEWDAIREYLVEAGAPGIVIEFSLGEEAEEQKKLLPYRRLHKRKIRTRRRTK